MKKLQVVYAGCGERWTLGTLADTGRQILFEYSATAREQGMELAPLRAPLASTSALQAATSVELFCEGMNALPELANDLPIRKTD